VHEMFFVGFGWLWKCRLLIMDEDMHDDLGGC
jgi:hypothetical protein